MNISSFNTRLSIFQAGWATFNSRAFEAVLTHSKKKKRDILALTDRPSKQHRQRTSTPDPQDRKLLKKILHTSLITLRGIETHIQIVRAAFVLVLLVSLSNCAPGLRFLTQNREFLWTRVAVFSRFYQFWKNFSFIPLSFYSGLASYWSSCRPWFSCTTYLAHSGTAARCLHVR